MINVRNIQIINLYYFVNLIKVILILDVKIDLNVIVQMIHFVLIHQSAFVHHINFGSYCHLTHSVCQTSNNPCQNNGLYVPADDRIDLTAFTSFCPEDYSGERCQNENNRIDIYLDKTFYIKHFIITDAFH
jgi:hypothetical protein